LVGCRPRSPTLPAPCETLPSFIERRGESRHRRGQRGHWDCLGISRCRLRGAGLGESHLGQSCASGRVRPQAESPSSRTLVRGEGSSRSGARAGGAPGGVARRRRCAGGSRRLVPVCARRPPGSPLEGRAGVRRLSRLSSLVVVLCRDAHGGALAACVSLRHAARDRVAACWGFAVASRPRAPLVLLSRVAPAVAVCREASSYGVVQRCTRRRSRRVCVSCVTPHATALRRVGGSRLRVVPVLLVFGYAPAGCRLVA